MSADQYFDISDIEYDAVELVKCSTRELCQLAVLNQDDPKRQVFIFLHFKKVH